MIKPALLKIFTLVIILLLLDLAFMPVVSAQGTESIKERVSGGNSESGTAISDSGENSALSVSIVPAAAIVFIGIVDIPAEIAAILGFATAVSLAIVYFKDDTLAFIDKSGNYVKITDAIAIAAINGALDVLHLRAAPNSYEEAYRKGLPTDKHEVIKKDDQHRKLPETDGKNSSKDLVDSDGKLIQRRYYDDSGKAEVDWDYSHDHGKGIPHQHRFIYNPDGTIKERINIKFNPDGSETNI
jgi:hypothetical protein